MSFGHIDTQQVLSAMTFMVIPSKDKNKENHYRLCFDKIIFQPSIRFLRKIPNVFEYL